MFPKIDKIIIKLDAVDDNDYKNKTGVHFMDEETLIIGDNNNNVYLVFDKEDETITTKNITKHMHVIRQYYYDYNSIIHKKHEVTPMPAHLQIIIINNNVTNITNNLQSVYISNNVDFFEKNYKKGGMYALEDMKRHPEWIPEYRKCIEVKRMNMCKSCNNSAHKGCCANYDYNNRTMKTMVIGWHK